jgi:hypothetical protein
MPRARNIKPAIMDNEELAELPMSARLLFIYLWMLADRDGRLEDRPKRIAAQALPYDRDVDVDQALDDLQAFGFIVRYSVDGLRCIQVINFEKHQHPHVKEKGSDLPPYVPEIKQEYELQEQAPDKPCASTVQAPEKHHESPSDILIPDSLIPDVLIPDTLIHGNGALPSVSIGHVSDCAEPCLPVLRIVGHTETPFDRFWQAYPRKTSKDEAKKAFAKIRVDVDLLITDVQERLRSGHWSISEKRYIPHPSTYLNQKRWQDEIVPGHKAMDAQSVADRTNKLIQEMDQLGEDIF